MAQNVQHGPSSETDINPKLSSDVHYWSERFGVTGEALHEAIRVHGTTVLKVKAALEGHKHDKGHHDKRGA